MESWKGKSLAAVVAAGILLTLVVVTNPSLVDKGEKKSFSELSGSSSAEAVFYEEGERIASLDLEVADSEEERRIGLMNRTSLEEGSGMVFVWNSSSRRAFWMKNTYIPLDMIFVSGNGTVLNVEEADPQPNAMDSELETYTSEGEARYVIETSQGFSEEEGIEQGVKVVFQRVSR